MKIKFLLFLCILFIATDICSQINIKGTVVDKDTNQPITGLTIQAMRLDSVFITGTISDIDGKFEMNNMTLLPEYLIRCSGIGYKTTFTRISSNTISDNISSIDTIYITQSSYKLNEIVVKGENRKREVDKIVFYPSTSIRKSTLSAWEVLEKIRLPNIVIDKSSLSITTSDNKKVLFKINGAIASASEYLALHPNDIIKVNYYDNPSIRYAEENIGAIIDITTKEQSNGWTAGLRSENTFTTISTGNSLFFKANHKRSQWSLLYNNKYRNYKKGWTNSYLNYSSSNDNSTSLEMIGKQMPYSYMEHTISAIYNLNTSNFNINIDIKDVIYNCTKDEIIQQVFENKQFTRESLSSPRTKYNIPSLDLYSSLKLTENDNVYINLIGTYKDNTYNYTYTETKYNTMKPYLYQYHVNGKRHSIIAETLYEHTFKNKLQLTGGIKYSYAKTNNNYTLSINAKNHSTSSDIYGYMQVLGRFTHLSYQAGIGISNISYNEENATFNKAIFRPMIRITYNPIHNIELSFTSHTTPQIPALSDMVNVTKTINKYEYEKGNPNLKPFSKYSNKITVTYNQGNLYLQGGYEMIYAKQSFAPNCYVENNSVIYDMAIFDQSINHVFMLYSNYEFINNRLSASFFGNHINYNHKLNEYTQKNSVWNYGGNITLNLSDMWDVNISLYDFRNEYNGILKYKQEAIVYAETSYKLKNWLFCIGIWNPFRTKVQLSEKEYQGNHVSKKVSSFYRDKANMVYCRLSVTLGGGKKYKEPKRKITNYDTEDGIKR